MNTQIRDKMVNIWYGANILQYKIIVIGTNDTINLFDSRSELNKLIIYWITELYEPRSISYKLIILYCT